MGDRKREREILKNGKRGKDKPFFLYMVIDDNLPKHHEVNLTIKS